jgi:hypothetical protein
MTNWNLLWEKNFKRYENMYVWYWDFNIKIWEYSRYYHSFWVGELEDMFLNTGFEIVENRIFEWKNNIISILRNNR